MVNGKDGWSARSGVILMMCAVLASCGGSGGDSSTTSASTASGASTTTSSATGSTAGGGISSTGTSTPSVVVVAPSAPTIIGTTLGANSVALAFTPPVTVGSSALVIYTATCGDGTVRLVGSATASPVVVSGLTQQVNYSCTVSASNSEINSPESAPVTVNLPSPTAFSVFASAPQSVAAASGNGSLSLTFTPPATDGGFAVLGYQATCSGGKSASSLESPIIVSGLRNGTTYSCTVTAMNAQGAGSASASVSATPSASAVGPTAPAAPTAVIAEAGNGQVLISFSAPTSTGGSPITGYSATCTTPNDLPVSGSALGSPIRILGAVNGNTYTCSVWSTNAYGSSAAVAASAATPRASLSNKVASPGQITLGPVLPSLAADGLTAVVAQVKAANGDVYDGPDLLVNFSSPCTTAGKATLDATVTTRGGVATAVYQPRGCSGLDLITASVPSSALTASAKVIVSSVSALSAKAALGKQMFFDRGLSGGGNVSCANCHAPSQAYFLPGPQPTPPGGLVGTSVGFRSAPSAAYAALATSFRFLSVTNQQGTVNNAANGKLGTPRGGVMWDGRDSDVFIQAKGPFTSPHEMANANSAAVLSKLLTRPYLTAFNAVYGNTTAASNPDTVLTNIANAIGQFETEDRSFMPFNSKYDAVQAGTASFTPQEANGQQLFFNTNKAACFGCHTPFSQARAAQSPAMFTDAGYRSDGVPRNWTLPYNVDSTATGTFAGLGLGSLLNGSGLGAPDRLYYDLGFCGPFRTDSLLDSGLCGVFRTPGLRNVALKGSYFHNGVYNDLNQVLAFYLNRDAFPQFIFRKADGSADIAFNDMPTQYQANVAVRPPFTTVPGGRLTPSEMQDLMSFLCTLTDGYDPSNPAAYRQPAQCARAVRR